MTNVEINTNEVKSMNTVKNIEIVGNMVSLRQIEEYGSQTENLHESKYSVNHNGKIALFGGSKFTPSKFEAASKAKISLDDGSIWYVGLSKTALEGI